jgi:cytosine/adenosine deaminase-related metal-dependent hydrolase
MILNNLKAALTGDPLSIRVTNGRIAEISASAFDQAPGQLSIDLPGAIVFPGLVNSHDHLDFNLFPALGDRTYRNYTEWGHYIHREYKDKISEVLRVPLALREHWGIYKNLLNGVTTVVNHGKKIRHATALITVHENCQCIHSVRFERKWWLALNNPLKKNIPVAIHTGEGTDEPSSHEIDTLINHNLLKRQLIGVHGVAMDTDQARAFKALVWCPESNHFLLHQTAPVDRLKKDVPILFGTDSTLTGNWNLWNHIRRARETHCLTDDELFDSLTINAAAAWDLGCGDLSPFKLADIVVAKSDHTGDAFFGINPEDILLVLHRGNISLFDEKLRPQLTTIDPDNYSRIYINGACKYIRGNLPMLMQKIRGYYPTASFPVT